MTSLRAVNNQQQNDGGGTSDGEVEQPGNNPNSNRIVDYHHNQRTDGDVLPPPALNGAAEGMAALNIEDEEGGGGNGDFGGDEEEQQHNLSIDDDDDDENNICPITYMHPNNPVRFCGNQTIFDPWALLNWFNKSFDNDHLYVTHPTTRDMIPRSEIQNHIDPMTDELRERLQTLQDGWRARSLDQM
jgi:hypothetical protein